ncbi:MAG: TonB-dependent receptor [Bacteroidales bacterium]|nr:TonB-dependent receptor [Bacteroidales bacterium]
MKTKLIFTFLFLMAGSMLFAQYTLRGIVVNATDQHPVSGASIIEISSGIGTITRPDGSFTLAISEMDGEFLVSAMGFDKIKQAYTFEKQKHFDAGKIRLNPASIALDEVNIIASYGTEGITPLSINTIPSGIFEEQAGSKTFPEAMQMVAGVYATRTGGGFGDASVNIRGFKQENVSLLLNGIPISSVENGLVYWSNWEGLAGATHSLQIQKGIGTSGLAVNSVGGTINIITKTTEAEEEASLRYSMTDYGTQNTSLNFSTGRMDNGFAITFAGSRTSGDGYVKGTYVDSWAYMLNAGKEFGKNHKLVFTIMGSPDRHGQRNFMFSQEEYQKYGRKYNKDWGSYNGKMNNMSENFYHKPLMSINHYYRISDKSLLATSLFYSSGKGGGKWAENFSGPYVFMMKNPSGQIDWNAIYTENSTHSDEYISTEGDTLRNFSKNAQTHFLASHYWYGAISSLKHNFNNALSLNTGVMVRHFKSSLSEKIIDLLGGQYFIDDYAWAIDGRAGRNIIKKTGDIVRIDNGAVVDLGLAYAQLVYHQKKINAFLGGNISQNRYAREDRYNYISDIRSETISKSGADIKGGINYQLMPKQYVFANAGYFSKAPYHKFVFPGYNNNPAARLKNEKVQMLEAGYGIFDSKFSAKISVYYTLWKDKALLSNEYLLIDQQQSRAMVSGLSAKHKGVEAEIKYSPDSRIDILAFGSMGDWKWNNNVNAVLFNNENQAFDTVNVYAKGLYVGDAPQLQAGLSMNLKTLKKFRVGVQWTYNDRMYADFDPSNRQNALDDQQPYRLPSYALTDINISYAFKVFNSPANASIRCQNLFNTEYILRGKDGNTHDLQSFTGFWGFGRTFSFSIGINL